MRVVELMKSQLALLGGEAAMNPSNYRNRAYANTSRLPRGQREEWAIAQLHHDVGNLQERYENVSYLVNQDVVPPPVRREVVALVNKLERNVNDFKIRHDLSNFSYENTSCACVVLFRLANLLYDLEDKEKSLGWDWNQKLVRAYVPPRADPASVQALHETAMLVHRAAERAVTEKLSFSPLAALGPRTGVDTGHKYSEWWLAGNVSEGDGPETGAWVVLAPSLGHSFQLSRNAMRSWVEPSLADLPKRAKSLVKRTPWIGLDYGSPANFFKVARIIWEEVDIYGVTHGLENVAEGLAAAFPTSGLDPDETKNAWILSYGDSERPLLGHKSKYLVEQPEGFVLATLYARRAGFKGLPAKHKKLTVGADNVLIFDEKIKPYKDAVAFVKKARSSKRK